MPCGFPGSPKPGPRKDPEPTGIDKGKAAIDAMLAVENIDQIINKELETVHELDALKLSVYLLETHPDDIAKATGLEKGTIMAAMACTLRIEGMDYINGKFPEKEENFRPFGSK